MKVSYEAYHSFSAPLEGRVPTMYCDVLGLITTGVGNLINALPQALALPWLLADGAKANNADIAADWHKLHDNAAYYAKRAWFVYTKTMRCHLDDDGIDALVQRALAANEAIIKKRFPKWNSFPADAQLAIMSIAWAVGAGFYVKFTNLAHCIDAQDWEGCVATCQIKEEGNPGVRPRNEKNRFCFHNAALVKSGGLPADTLHWPAIVPAGAFKDPTQLPTQESLIAAIDAKNAAELSQATWQSHELSRYVTPGSGAAMREYESADDETDPPPDVA